MLVSYCLAHDRNAPDFVYEGEAGIAVDHAMRRWLAVVLQIDASGWWIKPPSSGVVS